MDFSPFTLQQLRDVEKQLARELARRIHEERWAAQQQIIAIAQAAGLPLLSLYAVTSTPNPPKGKRVALRYRHPDHPELQWTGRGSSPEWVKAWETRHGNRDGLQIAAEQNPSAEPD